MKLLATPVMLAVLLSSCFDRTQPDASPAAIVCGTVVGRIRGNADLLLLKDLASSQAALERLFPLRPQIVVWRPATWTPATIRVAFLDGDVSTRAFVMGVASEWLTGLKRKFIESSDADAELRVTFTGTGAWSKIGREAEAMPAGQPTMGLASLVQSSDANLRRAYVLHEFGHALGALHEHQRHDAPLTWNRDVVYDYYLREYRWERAQVDSEVIDPIRLSSLEVSPGFDRMSVMMYPLLKEFTKEQFVQPWNSQITKWDREIMARLYQ